MVSPSETLPKLAKEYPARLIVFDLLADATGGLTGKRLSERRAALEGFVKAAGKNPVLALSNATRSAATAMRWLSQPGLDGIMAKPLDQPYRPGERIMRKFKIWHTADAVLAGYYEDEATRTRPPNGAGLFPTNKEPPRSANYHVDLGII